jgi:prepilin-type N-terminal cleavage/methylation domain-containing protein
VTISQALTPTAINAKMDRVFSMAFGDMVMPRVKAFSLIELLVVIGIIALLVGLVAPALSNARERGRAAVCENNIRQLVMAMTIYADDLRGGRFFPDSNLPVTPDEVLVLDEKDSWVFTLAKTTFTSDLEGARCPSDESPYWNQDYPFLTGRHRLVSYGANSYLANPEPNNPAWSGLREQIRRPTNTILLGELTEANSGYAVGDEIYAYDWAPDEEFQYRASVEADRHIHRPWWGFVDGHVATYGLGEVYAYESYSEAAGPTQWTANKFDPLIAK